MRLHLFRFGLKRDEGDTVTKKRSSLKADHVQRRVKGGSVRFHGIPSDGYLAWVGFLIQHFRAGTFTLKIWGWLIALISTADFFLIPFANVVAAATKDEGSVQHNQVVDTLGSTLLTITTAMDAAFIANIIVHLAKVRPEAL